MTASSSGARSSQAEVFVHLGDRLLAIERVKAGVMTAAQAARALAVTADQIWEWQRIYAADRTVMLSEFRSRARAKNGGLMQRARALATLVADAERLLRELHVELIREVGLPIAVARFSRRASK
jgi:hypothetical protein